MLAVRFLAMNKARREEIARLKHIKRCKALMLKPEEHYCYKAQGKPCSCYMCSPYKYSRKVKHKGSDGK
jgi:hypothetical protein